MVTARARVSTQAAKTRAHARGSEAQSGLDRGLTAGRAHTAGTTGAMAQGSAMAVVTRARSWLARGRCRWQWRLG